MCFTATPFFLDLVLRKLLYQFYAHEFCQPIGTDFCEDRGKGENKIEQIARPAFETDDPVERATGKVRICTAGTKQ